MNELDGLTANDASRLAIATIDSAAATLDRPSRKTGLDSVSEGLQTIAARVRPEGRPWSETYGRLLTFETLATLPTSAVPLNVPRVAWPDIEIGLAAVLRDTAAGIFTDWDEEFFEKDIAVARLAVSAAEGRDVQIERWSPAHRSNENSP